MYFFKPLSSCAKRKTYVLFGRVPMYIAFYADAGKVRSYALSSRAKIFSHPCHPERSFFRIVILSEAKDLCTFRPSAFYADAGKVRAYALSS
jgi:hypothetical protein